MNDLEARLSFVGILLLVTFWQGWNCRESRIFFFYLVCEFVWVCLVRDVKF